jgi:hypothetical protein
MSDVAPRPLHPRHGTHEPVSGVPDRAPASVRRTSTLDVLRPQGLQSDAELVGISRQLVTRADGSAGAESAASLHAEVAYMDGRALLSLSTQPPRPGLDTLLGHTVGSGFRRALDVAHGAVDNDDRLLYALLDDMPGGVLVSGQVVAYGSAPRTLPVIRNENLCAGWATGASIMDGLINDQLIPVVTGPAQPGLESETDALAWHVAPELPPNAMRRRRRIDILRRPDETIAIDAMFCDSHTDADGREFVIHEYTVTAVADAQTWLVLESAAIARVLPWQECPMAAASAGRITGMTVTGLRRQVRDEFVGPSTCTHLNDLLRGLEDVAVMANALPG